MKTLVSFLFFGLCMLSVAQAQFVSTGNSSADPIYYNGAGNVGIGNNNPQNLLDLRANRGNYLMRINNGNFNNGGGLLIESVGFFSSLPAFRVSPAQQDPDIEVNPYFSVYNNGVVQVSQHLSVGSAGGVSAEGYIANFINAFSEGQGLRISAGASSVNRKAILDCRTATSQSNPTMISQFVVYTNGKIGAGTTLTGTSLPTDFNEYRMFVKDGIRTEKVKVDLASTGWGDYVFEPSYRLRPLVELEAFIKAHKHLPEVPSEQELEENGLNLGEMHKIQMVKIEELTLYLIEQQKQIEVLRAEIEALKKQK